jgi:hypothetical protein
LSLRSPHLLLTANNVRRVKNNLVNVIDAAAIGAIEAEICTNCAQLYVLGRNHYLFAKRQSNRVWRQKVSRLYYGAYNVSRAVRLCAIGEYSTDTSDHKKIEAIPDDFPNKNTYANRLGVLRDDRNLCDYDHTANLNDLILVPADALQLVTDFLRDARDYLEQHGVEI